MAVSLTYDSQLSRVRVEVDGLGSAAYATVERSVNQATWATVRGGLDVAVIAGEIAVDDYEFAADVPNYYRVRYAATATFVAAGAADHDDNLPVTPGLPAGLVAGDRLIELTAIRNAAGVPAVPAGYGDLWTASNFAARSKVATSSELVPTQSFTGGVAGASTSAQLAAFRGCAISHSAIQVQVNASAQNIATPALTPQRHNSVIIWAAWKQDDWTSVAPPAATTEIGEPSTTLGDDQGITWAYQIQTTATTVGASSFTVTGGASAISYALVFELFASELTQTNSITPSLNDQVWLKFIARPFLNQAVDAYGEINVTRRARNAVYPVVGRSVPVGVTDVRAGRTFSLSVKTLTADAHERLDLALAGGDPVFVHAPPDSPVPTMYAVIGDTQDDQPVAGSHLWTLPMIEVAAPAPEIVGATITWQGVLNQYGTWQDVLDGETTWQDLLTNIGDPGDVIIG